MIKKWKYVIFLLLLSELTVFSKCTWISHPDNTGGVYYFRKTFKLSDVPEQFVIDISGDSKFILFINNIEILEGSNISSPEMWNYNRVDISKYLRNGLNVISVEILKWDFHYLASSKNPPSLFVMGKDNYSKIINTNDNNGWKTIKSKAHRFYFFDENQKTFEYANDIVDYKQYYYHWQTVDYNDSGWLNPEYAGDLVYNHYRFSPWNLVSDPVKNMSVDTFRFSSIISHNTTGEIPEDFLTNTGTLRIPKNKIIKLVIAADRLCNGYLNIDINRGNGCEIKLIYSEALYNREGKKLNRNENIGNIYGKYDLFKCFECNKIKSSSQRTCRFLGLEITSSDEELFINDLYLTSYVNQNIQPGKLVCSDESLSKIWDAGVNTINILSKDLLVSSVSNENIQFLPETWAIGLTQCYFNGFTFPLKTSIQQFYQSMFPEGLTNACAPCNTRIVIPHYSLYYILMIYDYYQYSGDIDFIRDYLPAIGNILEWFEKRVNNKDVINVSFLDENVKFRRNNNNMYYGTAFNTILFIYTLKKAAELYDICGEKEKPVKIEYLSEKLRRGIIRENYIRSQSIFREEKNENLILKITNIFAYLADIEEVENKTELIETIISSDEYRKISLFERFFLGRLLIKLQDGEIYATQILPWHNMVLDGLTTLGSDTYRSDGSDVYGGGVTPCLNIINLTAGIYPYTPGFEKIMIAPAPGDIEEFNLSCHLPQGLVQFGYVKNVTGSVFFEIKLPDNVTGYLQWKEKLTPLSSGINKIEK